MSAQHSPGFVFDYDLLNPIVFVRSPPMCSRRISLKREGCKFVQSNLSCKRLQTLLNFSNLQSSFAVKCKSRTQLQKRFGGILQQNHVILKAKFCTILLQAEVVAVRY